MGYAGQQGRWVVKIGQLKLESLFQSEVGANT